MQTKDINLTGSAQQVMNQVRKAVVGKDSILLWVLAAILAKGHILLEDIPGVGKTTLLPGAGFKLQPDAVHPGCAALGCDGLHHPGSQNRRNAL